jgi:ABC-type antimicrobial peptide transport system permease subunit
MRMPAAVRIAPQAPRGGLLIRLAPGTDHAATVARLDRLFDSTNAVRPQEVGDLARVDSAPMLVALVFGIAAGAALAHLLLTSVRRRRRDLAILKTLGFTRPQVYATIAWQATTVAAVGVLVGVPLGVALGRFGWTLFAHGLGVVAEPVTPVGLSVVVIPAAILFANAIAAIPARAAAATPPALVLRAE